MVEAAGSGHPGTAMSLAPAALLLFQRHLRHDPSDPSWVGRDRFVLSCGHSSVTLYIQLLLSGYGLTVEDLAHTVYDCLGIDAAKKLMSPGDRPIDIVREGKTRKELLA